MTAATARAAASSVLPPEPAAEPLSHPATTLSLEDVARLRTERTPEARAAIAAKFGAAYDDLCSGDARAMAEAVLDLLLRDLETTVRQVLSHAVAASLNLSREAANLLARDAIEVARPILEQSPVLSEDDLLDVLRTHAKQHALAIAGRSHLSERLSDALVEDGQVEVVRRLCGNRGASLSGQTADRIVSTFAGDREIHDRLARRPALPHDLVERLVGEMGERLEWQLVQARRMSAHDAKRLMRSVRQAATQRFASREQDAHELERAMQARHAEGDLGPEEVLLHLRNGEIRAFEVALSVLAGVHLQPLRQLLYGQDKRAIAALCIRGGFGVAQYVMLRMVLDLADKGASNHGRDATYSRQDMHFIQEQYEAMLFDDDLVDRLLQT